MIDLRRFLGADDSPKALIGKYRRKRSAYLCAVRASTELKIGELILSTDNTVLLHPVVFINVLRFLSVEFDVSANKELLNRLPWGESFHIGDKGLQPIEKINGNLTPSQRKECDAYHDEAFRLYRRFYTYLDTLKVNQLFNHEFLALSDIVLSSSMVWLYKCSGDFFLDHQKKNWRIEFGIN